MRLVHTNGGDPDFVLRLESTATLKAAMGLYHSMGYQIIPNYGPYREIPISICMEKLLG